MAIADDAIRVTNSTFCIFSQDLTMSNVVCPVRQTEYDRAKWQNQKQIEIVTYIYGLPV